ncbi:unnamed protein product, partial [Brenthis ino]
MMCYILILIFLSSKVLALENEINMIADVIAFYNKPSGILVRACWGAPFKKKLINELNNMAPPKPVQFIRDVEDIPSAFSRQDLMIICDTNCSDNKQFLAKLDRMVLRPDISEIAMMIIGAVTQQGSCTEFKANIVALLQSTSNQIRTLTDLFNSKLELGVEDTPYNRYFFSAATEPLKKAIYDKKIAPRGSKANFISLQEGVLKLQKKPFAFNMFLGSGYRLVEKYFLEHEKCGLQEIAYIDENKPWQACGKKSPFKEIFKIGLFRNVEHGINSRETRLLFAKKPACTAHGVYKIMYTKFILLVFACVVGKSIGRLRCYACGFSSVDTDRSCLTITNSTPRVECTMTYCTIQRQEFRDPAGVVASFTRGCVDNPVFLNHLVEDETFRTYYRACTNDLCNIGDGIQSVTGGSLSPTPAYNGTNLYVPGTNSAGNNQNHLFIFITITILYLLL